MTSSGLPPIGTLARTSPVAGSSRKSILLRQDATHTAPRPTAIPLVPVPALAVLSAVTVTGQRLYNLVDLPRVANHVLTLEPESGVEGYAFTFG